MSVFDSFNYEDITNKFTKIKDNLFEIYSEPSMQIITAVIVIIFIALSIYIYFTYVKPQLDILYVPNREFIPPGKDKLIILWFYTEWCPFCKSTYVEWKNFKNKVEQKNYNIPIEFREIDCDKEDALVEKYNIQEYPSIRIVYKDQVYIYDAKPDTFNLLNFLSGIIPEESNNNNNNNNNNNDDDNYDNNN